MCGMVAFQCGEVCNYVLLYGLDRTTCCSINNSVAKCAIWMIIPRVTGSLRLVIARGEAEC